MNEAQLIERATKAKAILESPVYQESYDLCRQAILTRIEKTPLTDTPQAETLRHCLKLLRDVRANLELTMKQGTIAQFKVAELDARSKNPLRGIFKHG